jgi:hypothetical protein
VVLHCCLSTCAIKQSLYGTAGAVVHMMLLSVHGPQKQYWRPGEKQFSEFDRNLRVDQYREVLISMLKLFGSTALLPHYKNPKPFLSRTICRPMVRHLILHPPTVAFSNRPNKTDHQICTKRLRPQEAIST